MWRPWGKSTVKIHDTSSPFSCSSFKDIHRLCTDDPSPSSSPAAASKRSSAVFHRVRLANSIIRSWSTRPLPKPDSQPETPQLQPELHSDALSPKQDASISIPGAEKRVVIYFTSLRVVRSTFDDCRVVRSIFRGFRVQIDERDLSMDSAFLTELQGILGGQSKLTLPRVFIGGRYIGGADEVIQLHEIGELKKLVQSLPQTEPGVCDECGDYGFVLCEDCHGSHKLYTEKSGFKTCTVCNENGLIRCPSCSSAPL